MWSRMRALVTGSSGFVGHHISKELRSRGWYVVGVDVDRSLRGGSVNEFHYMGLQDYIYDVADGSRERYDLVVHCAYEVGGRSHIDGKNLALAHNLELDAVLFDWGVRTEQ